MLTLDRVADLSAADRDAARALAHAVYPPEFFDTWSGRHLEWATPEWCVRTRAGGELVSFVGVYVREATHDGRPVRVGGVGNVKTHPSARRQGYAARGIRRAVEFFAEQGVGFGLLVCKPLLISYYANLGWGEFDGRLLVRQRGEACEFTLNRVMTIAVGSERAATGAVDLGGPPW